ncbi:unnamed protein product [Amoebophrya sp. A120]|nr:unnamed protein product [Amoebophrya sp. A120]|eukprot:GSA120T00011495001.1
MAATSTTGVMSQHAVRDNPVIPECVTVAFERYQMGCLHEELAGPEPRKLQALDIILDICKVDTKAQEGVMQGLLDVLVHILRGSPSPSVKEKVVKCFLLLSKFPNARQKLVEDSGKLEELRHAVQASENEQDFFGCLQTMRNVCLYPKGADALVATGYWDWLISMLLDEAKSKPSDLRKSVYESLYKLKIECNLDHKNTSTPKSLIRLLLKSDFTMAQGPEYATSALEFCIAVCRLDENKSEFIQNDGIATAYKVFLGNGTLAVAATDTPLVLLTSRALQFLGSLTVAVPGKKLVAETIGPAKIAEFFEQCLDVQSDKIERTLTQFMLEVCEHPDVRKALRSRESLVAKLRASEIRADEFGKKILKKLIDNIFWEP